MNVRLTGFVPALLLGCLLAASFQSAALAQGKGETVKI